MNNENNNIPGINNDLVNNQQPSVNDINSSANVINSNIPNFINNDTNASGSINNSDNISRDNNLDHQSVPQVLYDTTNYINDKPVEKSKKKALIKINPELKTSIILMVILLIIMMIVPSIFDLFVK